MARKRGRKSRKKVDVTHYEREKNGKTEQVRDHTREQMVNAAAAPPSFKALGRDEYVSVVGESAAALRDHRDAIRFGEPTEADMLRAEAHYKQFYPEVDLNRFDELFRHYFFAVANGKPDAVSFDHFMQEKMGVTGPAPRIDRNIAETTAWHGTSGQMAGKNYVLRRYPHPGKFEGGAVIDEYVWQTTMDSGGGGVGDVNEMGFYAERVDLGDWDSVSQIRDIAKEHSDALTEDEQAFIHDVSGAIVVERESGFVDVNYFETKDKLDQAWNDYEAEEEKFYESQGED